MNHNFIRTIWGNHYRFKQETCRILLSFRMITPLSFCCETEWHQSASICIIQMMNSWAEERVQIHIPKKMRKREELRNMPDFCNEILDGLGQYQNRKYRHDWLKSSVEMRVLTLDMLDVCTDRPFKQNWLAGSWKHSQMLGLCHKYEFVLLY